MEVIYKLFKEYGFVIIEDVLYVIGGNYQGVKIGNLCFVDIIILSFYLVKIIIIVEGGMVLINNDVLVESM